MSQFNAAFKREYGMTPGPVSYTHLDVYKRQCQNIADRLQAAAVILPLLTEAEHDVYRRGRNSHVNTCLLYTSTSCLPSIRSWARSMRATGITFF